MRFKYEPIVPESAIPEWLWKADKALCCVGRAVILPVVLASSFVYGDTIYMLNRGVTPKHLERTYAELSDAANEIGFFPFSLAAVLERPIRERAYRDFKTARRQLQDTR